MLASRKDAVAQQREANRRPDGRFGEGRVTEGILVGDFEDPWQSVPDYEITTAIIPHLDGNPREDIQEHLCLTLMAEPWCDSDAIGSLNSMRDDAVERRLARARQKADDPVNPDEWRNWVEGEIAYARASGNLEVVELLEDLKDSPAANMRDFHHCQLALRQSATVPQSMSREVRQIAGILDISTEDAQEVFLRARNEYRERGLTEGAPDWHTSGLTASYRFGDAIKHPPTDKATQWALHAALTDPQRSAHCPRLNAGYVVFDTETNGLDSKADILSITIRQYDAQGALVDELSTYVQPPKGVDGSFNLGDEKCRSIHGITANHVATAPTFADLGGRVHELMSGRTLIGHNIVSFDIPKVQASLARNGHPVLPRSPLVDTLRLARWKQPNPGVPAKEWRHTLEHACRRAGVPFDSNLAHDASYDVDRSQALFVALTSSGSTTGASRAA